MCKVFVYNFINIQLELVLSFSEMERQWATSKFLKESKTYAVLLVFVLDCYGLFSFHMASFF